MAVSQNQSDVAISALTSYLQAASPDDELSWLKQRLQQVEIAVQSLQRGK